MASTQVALVKNVWTQLTTTDKSGSINHQSGKTKVVYVEAAVTPVGLTPATPVMDSTIMGSSFVYWGVPAADFIWAYAESENATVTVSPKE